MSVTVHSLKHYWKIYISRRPPTFHPSNPPRAPTEMFDVWLLTPVINNSCLHYTRAASAAAGKIPAHPMGLIIRGRRRQGCCGCGGGRREPELMILKRFRGRMCWKKMAVRWKWNLASCKLGHACLLDILWCVQKIREICQPCVKRMYND